MVIVLMAVVATNTMVMMAVAPFTTSATPPFTSNSTFVEWKIGTPETVDTHCDSDIEAPAEDFIADKVLQAWEIHHKR